MLTSQGQVDGFAKREWLSIKAKSQNGYGFQEPGLKMGVEMTHFCLKRDQKWRTVRHTPTKGQQPQQGHTQRARNE